MFAQAVIDNENKFSSVGVIMVWKFDEAGNPSELRGFASGTLIQDRVMVTAGHFTAAFSALGGKLPPLIKIFASFNSVDARNPATWIPVIDAATHPSMPFCPPPPQCDPTDEVLVFPLQTGIADVGLILLEHPAEDSKPMELAESHTLEADDIYEDPMIIVGYGSTEPSKGDTSSWDGKRRYRFSKFQAVCDETWATWSVPSYVCHGDSGGAIIMNTDEDDHLVANVSDGGMDCRSHNNNNRLDTTSVQNWIYDTIRQQFQLPD